MTLNFVFINEWSEKLYSGEKLIPKLSISSNKRDIVFSGFT